jgi:hypothetical protein
MRSASRICRSLFVQLPKLQCERRSETRLPRGNRRCGRRATWQEHRYGRGARRWRGQVFTPDGNVRSAGGSPGSREQRCMGRMSSMPRRSTEVRTSKAHRSSSSLTTLVPRADISVTGNRSASSRSAEPIASSSQQMLRFRRTRFVVSSTSVSKPVAVRYAWKNDPKVNLFGRNGLPVGTVPHGFLQPRQRWKRGIAEWPAWAKRGKIWR